jgi:hypothetical protein
MLEVTLTRRDDADVAGAWEAAAHHVPLYEIG